MKTIIELENDIMELENDLEAAVAACNRYETFLKHILDTTDIEIRGSTTAGDMVGYIRVATLNALKSK